MYGRPNWIKAFDMEKNGTNGREKEGKEQNKQSGSSKRLPKLVATTTTRIALLDSRSYTLRFLDWFYCRMYGLLHLRIRFQHAHGTDRHTRRHFVLHRYIQYGLHVYILWMAPNRGRELRRHPASNCKLQIGHFSLEIPRVQIMSSFFSRVKQANGFASLPSFPLMEVES